MVSMGREVYGHAWVAIRNGIAIEGIDLWMFGGVAKLSKDSDSPGVEFRIAAAGPLVTLVIAIVCVGLGTEVSSGTDAIITPDRPPITKVTRKATT